MSAALEVQKAMFDALVASNELVAKLGGAFIYDDVPRQAKPPYVVFTKIDSEDWSTGSDEGLEHFVELHVWSANAGRKQCASIADMVRQIVLGMDFTSTGFHLVNLTHETTSTEPVSNEYFKATSVFRAVTEPSNL